LLICAVLAGFLLSLLERLSNLHWGKQANLEVEARRCGSCFTVFSVAKTSQSSLCNLLCYLFTLV